ncbi:hypothetical protein CVT24_010719 [Panaeolus cyanescens]|uniref:HNH nuclease domain-containing protein n=1 Tax=Panaeolus cyanescens TaxID=181874 RepID=A0A409YVW9_9AGAR|nr:hypothetical protein CVT24_010719 [Panaeolus cyanescens]
MDRFLKFLSQSARERAKIVDPNLGRCLIENCSQTQAVQLAHVFHWDPVKEPDLPGSLEWAWRMSQGALNLDTRRNLFFVGSSLYELYKGKKWALLPTEKDVLRFYDKKKLMILTRDDFPDTESQTYTYALIPLDDMDGVYITRQSGMKESSDVAVHDFPFNNFPTIVSHVDPRFVILHLGRTLFYDVDNKLRLDLIDRFPYLKRVWALSIRWTSPVPSFAFEDDTYLAPAPNTNSPNSTPSPSGTNRLRTPPRTNPSALKRKSTVLSDSSASDSGDGYGDDDDSVNTESSHQLSHSERTISSVGGARGSPREKKRRYLTSIELQRQETDDDLRSMKWTADRISNWAVDIGATKRVKLVDPNSGHCLVENCSPAQGVRTAQVFDWRLASDSECDLLDSLEWAWGMSRGSLNLNTRRNLFFVGASWHELYKDNKWALLPSREDVLKFYDEDGVFLLRRESFPPVEDGPFTYTLLPLDDLDGVYIARQSAEEGSNDVTIHDFPFDDFPTITCHVDPKFAIMHLGRTLFSVVDVEIRLALVAKFPYLGKVWALSAAWTSDVPKSAWRDETYLPLHLNDPPSTITLTKVQPARTPPRTNLPSLKRKLSMLADSWSDAEDDFEFGDSDAGYELESVENAASSRAGASSHTSQRTNSSLCVARGSENGRKRHCLTSVDARRKEANVDVTPVKWTADNVSRWAKKCCPPTPPAEPTLPLRRSTRIRKKPKRFLC